MTCENCDVKLDIPGRFIKVSAYTGGWKCAFCEDILPHNRTFFAEEVKLKEHQSTWDTYFHSICIAVSSKSPCLSRKIGAILVRDHSIVSMGFNGPSRGIPHCGRNRNLKDDLLIDKISHQLKGIPRLMDTDCPRRLLGYESGIGMQWCPAQHAEENCISNAARLGVSTVGTILYMNCIIPCKNCFGTLINAGISEIIVDKVESYDKHTQYLIDNSSIKIRRFEL